MTFAKRTARHSPEVHVAVIVWKQKEVSAIEPAIEEYAQNDAQHHKGQAGFLTVMQPVETTPNKILIRHCRTITLDSMSKTSLMS
jgi:hypothetical protein